MNETTEMRAAAPDGRSVGGATAPPRAAWERTAAVGGVAFVVLAVVATFVPGAPPASDASAAKVLTYFKDHTTGIEVAQLLGGLAVIGLLWWFGALWRAMARAEGEHPGLAVVASVSLGIGISLALLNGALMSAAAMTVDTAGEQTHLLYTLSLVVISMAGFAIASALAAVCALNARTRVLPAWTNYAGALAALAFLVSAGGVATDSNAVNIFALIAFLVWSVWILGTSVALSRRAATA